MPTAMQKLSLEHVTETITEPAARGPTRFQLLPFHISNCARSISSSAVPTAAQNEVLVQETAYSVSEACVGTSAQAVGAAHAGPAPSAPVATNAISV
jgi:hypothetical protein